MTTDMHLRVSRSKRVDGSVVEYYQLAESVWDPAKKRSVTRVVHSFGRVEDPAVVERLRRLARSVLRRVDAHLKAEFLAHAARKVVAVRRLS